MLIDLVTPKMSGPELARLLLRKRPRLKIRCLSGYTDDAAIRHGVLDSQLAYLQKPLTVESSTKKLREVLDAG